MITRSHQQSVTVQASPEAMCDLVSDITRTGEWSPVCTSCCLDDEAEARQAGAWFTDATSCGTGPDRHGRK